MTPRAHLIALLALALGAATSMPAAKQPRILSLICTPALTSGQAGTCTLTLTAKASGGGVGFYITSTPLGVLTAPMIVTVPAGKTSVVFQIAAK